jgi:hypothetical protein
MVVALLTGWLMLRELLLPNPRAVWRIAEGCGIRRRMAVNVRDIDGDGCKERCVLW